MFGDNKPVSVTISLLEPTTQPPDAAASCLTVKAATPGIEARALKSKQYRNSICGVGFQAVDTASPVHVLSIQKHGKISYLLPEHNNSRVSQRSHTYVHIYLAITYYSYFHILTVYSYLHTYTHITS